LGNLNDSILTANGAQALNSSREDSESLAWLRFLGR